MHTLVLTLLFQIAAVMLLHVLCDTALRPWRVAVCEIAFET